MIESEYCFIIHIYQLYEEIKNGKINKKQLELLEKRDNIFPLIDYRVYCSSG